MHERTWLTEDGRQVLMFGQKSRDPFFSFANHFLGFESRPRFSFVTHHQLMQIRLLSEIFGSPDGLLGLLVFLSTRSVHAQRRYPLALNRSRPVLWLDAWRNYDQSPMQQRVFLAPSVRPNPLRTAWAPRVPPTNVCNLAEFRPKFWQCQIKADTFEEGASDGGHLGVRTQCVQF